MIPFRKSLAFRLLIVSFILLALPLLVDSFIIIQSAYEDAIQDAKRNLAEVAISREIPIAEMQPAKRTALKILEAFLDLKEHFPQESNEELNKKLNELANKSNFHEILLLKISEDGTFKIVGSSDSADKNKDYTQFIQLMDIYAPENYDLGFFSFLAYHPTNFQPFFIVGRVVYSTTNQPIGVILVSSNIAEKIEKLLVPDLDDYPIHFALLLPNSIVFAASDSGLQFQSFVPIDQKFRTSFAKEEVFAGRSLPETPLKRTPIGYPFFEFIWKDNVQIGFINKLSTSSIALLAYASKKDIFAQPLIDFFDVYLGYFLILVIGGVVAYFLTRRLARPMFQLSNVMVAIQKGHLEKRYESDPLGYEINTVGDIFNHTIEALFQKQALVEQERIIKETYAQELRIGQQVQRNLLVEKMPRYPGVELATRYIPAKEVGGDFFDVFVKEDEKKQILALAIADASGKGVKACLYSLGVRSMLRTYAKEFNDVSKVMVKTNELFCKDTGDTGMFVTVLMAFFDQETKEMSYFSCGHQGPLLRKANGDVIALNHMAMAMGLNPIEAEAHRVQLEKGDLVLFYTDGVTEAHDMNFRLFSEERLMRFLREEGDGKVDEIADKLLEEVHIFAGKAPQHDDITLIVMSL